jgi:hypothetical protein
MDSRQAICQRVQKLEVAPNNKPIVCNNLNYNVAERRHEPVGRGKFLPILGNEISAGSSLNVSVTIR